MSFISLHKSQNTIVPTRPSLPRQEAKIYAPVGKCIYCGATDELTKEHIIPYALGGEWILPKASCKNCAKVTGAFEGEFARTILGPLRMLYNMPTRRPNDRPRHLPLKVKYPTSTDWEMAYVDRDICPFLVGMPIYPMPDMLTGTESEIRDAATKQLWLRGGGFWNNRDKHLQWLCDALAATEVMPTADVRTEPFCLTLAKVAHAFAAAELGQDQFIPFLTEMIRKRDLSSRARYIGGGRGNEPTGENLHQLEFTTMDVPTGLIVVVVRLLAVLGTPTYHVVVGQRHAA